MRKWLRSNQIHCKFVKGRKISVSRVLMLLLDKLNTSKLLNELKAFAWIFAILLLDKSRFCNLFVWMKELLLITVNWLLCKRTVLRFAAPLNDSIVILCKPALDPSKTCKFSNFWKTKFGIFEIVDELNLIFVTKSSISSSRLISEFWRLFWTIVSSSDRFPVIS